MALYIPIKKLEESIHSVRFSFGKDDISYGVAQIDRTTGAVSIEQTEADLDDFSQVSARVIHKLTQHWKKGEIPDSTCWAS